MKPTRQKTDKRRRSGAIRGVALATAMVLALTACASDSDDDGDGGDAGTDETTTTTSAATTTAAPEEMTTVSFLSPVPPSMFFFPAFVGQELGFFAEEGIELEYEAIGEDISMTSLLVNGRVDIASPGATEVFQGLDAGQEFEVIYDYYTSGVEGIVVPADSPVQSLIDLEGATVGIAEDEVRSLLAFSLEQEGMSVDDLTIANIGTAGPIIANAFESGDIDAFVGSVLDFSALQVAGMELRNITPELVAAVPAASFAVTPERAAELGDALPGFLRAWSRALHVGLEDPALVEQIMREVSPEEWEDEEVGAATLQVALALQAQGPDDYGSLAVEAWQLGVEQALVAGDIETELDVTQFLNDSYIPAANDFDREATSAAAG